MTVRPGVVSSMLTTSGSDWWQAIILLAFSLIGGLAPLWCSAGFAVLLSKPADLVTFSSNGEFAIYCAAIIAPTFYLILHERTPQRLSGQALLALVALILLLAAVFAYMAIEPVPSRVITLPEFKRDLYSHASGVLLLASIGFALVVTALDNARTNPDVRKLTDEQEQALRAQFDRIKDKQP